MSNYDLYLLGCDVYRLTMFKQVDESLIFPQNPLKNAKHH
jgi:hypothetical protein